MRISTLIAASGLALLVTLTGCGTADSPGSETPPAGGSTPTQTASPGEQVDLDGLKKQLTEGTASITTAHVYLKVSGSTGQTVEGDIDQTDPDNIKMSFTTNSSGATVKTIVVDKNTYVSTDGGATWQRSTESAPIRPLQQQEEYLSHVKEAVFQGTEDVEGVRARAYKLTLQLPSSPTPTEYEIWVDDDHRIIRALIEMDVSGSAVTYDTGLSDFGEPVTIEAPKVA